MNLRAYLYSIKQYLLNKPVCDELKKFRGLHRGQRCFIIGTGPSLTTEDLDKLKDEVTFGSNRIFEIYPRTQWRPTYYMNQDFTLIEKYADTIETLEPSALFLPIEFRERYANKKNMHHFVLRHRDFYPKDADFSKNLHHYLGQGFTVTYGAIQLAHYMGFSEVYLLGIDHNYAISLNEKGIPVVNEGVKDYFAGSTASNKGLNLPRIAESTVAYMTARKFADKSKHFIVYNATRGGKLEAFPRVNLDDVLNRR